MMLFRCAHRWCLPLAGLTLPLLLWAEPVASIRYAPVSEGPGAQRLLAGESTLLAQVAMCFERLEPGERLERTSAQEVLYLVREGQVTVQLGDRESCTVGPGSIVLVMPGDRHVMAAAGDEVVRYYEMRYRAKEPADAGRGRAAGGSLVVDFEALDFHPHDKGGLRRYFDRATAMTNNFEMHMTTLNEGITSHPPHTHRAEEIILMVEGEAEELINGEPYALQAGELVFLDSMVPHGIRNTGRGSCRYFAFQWR